ncbi:MAG: hypothetical protein Q4C09_02525 [Atopobiaceae bacterium]|nr:hypothetical protein [Atopobiaceae bacterium]
MEYDKIGRKADDQENVPIHLTLGLVIEPMADGGEGCNGLGNHMVDEQKASKKPRRMRYGSRNIERHAEPEFKSN